MTGTRCRNGSGTGVGVRRRPSSKKVYIYLEGGGACFNDVTCAAALDSFGKLAFDAWADTVGQLGVFDPDNTDNPLRGWSAVYVPYCSGDVHAGDAVGVDVSSIFPQQTFVGYENIGLCLQRIVPTFKDAVQVVLLGVSAGGFGAALNYDRVAAAFCPTPVTLIDDSGPPLSDEFLAPCLQKQWRELWNFSATLPDQCTGCEGPDGGGLVNYLPYLSTRWPNARMGLISSTHDAVISTFFGYGAEDCTEMVPLSGDVYEAGLEALRQEYLAATGQWGTFYVASIQHTWLLGPGFSTTQVKGRKLTRWIEDLLGGEVADVGP